MISGYGMILIVMSILTLLDVAHCCKFVCSNINLKNDFFETCFQQSAKGKMTAWDVWQYHVFVKVLTFYLDLPLKSRIHPTPPHPFKFSLSNQFLLQEVCFLYVQYIRYISNISNVYLLLKGRVTGKHKQFFEKIMLTVAGACFSQPRQEWQHIFKLRSTIQWSQSDQSR